MGSIPSKRKSVSEGNPGVATTPNTPGPESVNVEISAGQPSDGAGLSVPNGVKSDHLLDAGSIAEGEVSDLSVVDKSDKRFSGKDEDNGDGDSLAERLKRSTKKTDPSTSKSDAKNKIKRRKFRDKRPRTVAVAKRISPAQRNQLETLNPRKIVIRKRRNPLTRSIPTYGVKVNNIKLKTRRKLRKNLENLIEESESLANKKLIEDNTVGERDNSNKVNERLTVQEESESVSTKLPQTDDDEYEETGLPNTDGQQQLSEQYVNNTQFRNDTFHSDADELGGKQTENSRNNEEEEKNSLQAVDSNETSSREEASFTDDLNLQQDLNQDPRLKSTHSSFSVDEWRKTSSQIPLNGTITIVRNNHPEDRLVRGFVDTSIERKEKKDFHIVAKQPAIDKIKTSKVAVRKRKLGLKKKKKLTVDTDAQVKIKTKQEYNNDVSHKVHSLVNGKLNRKIVTGKRLKRKTKNKNGIPLPKKKDLVRDITTNLDRDRQNGRNLISNIEVEQLDTIDKKNIELVVAALKRKKKVSRLKSFFTRNRKSLFPTLKKPLPSLKKKKDQQVPLIEKKDVNLDSISNQSNGFNFLRRLQNKSKLGYVSKTFVETNVEDEQFPLLENNSNTNSTEPIIPNERVEAELNNKIQTIESRPTKNKDNESIEQAKIKPTKVKILNKARVVIPLKRVRKIIKKRRAVFPLNVTTRQRKISLRKFSSITPLPLNIDESNTNGNIGIKRVWPDHVNSLIKTNKKRVPLLPITELRSNEAGRVQSNNMALMDPHRNISVSEKKKLLQKYPPIKLNLPIIKITRPESDDDGDDYELYRGMDDYWNNSWHPNEDSQKKRLPALKKDRQRPPIRAPANKISSKKKVQKNVKPIQPKNSTSGKVNRIRREKEVAQTNIKSKPEEYNVPEEDTILHISKSVQGNFDDDIEDKVNESATASKKVRKYILNSTLYKYYYML